MTTILFIADLFSNLTFNGGVEIFGTLIGLVYLYLQYKASPWFFTVAIINAIPFVYLYLMKGNYASALLFAYYGYVGLHAILSGTTGKGESSFTIGRLPRQLYPRLVAIFLALWGAIYFVLVNITTIVNTISEAIGTNLPVSEPLLPAADAFVTAASFVSMWILSKKYIENWVIWVVVNAVFVYLQIVSGLYTWAALFTIYMIVAVMGYFNWRKLMLKQS